MNPLTKQQKNSNKKKLQKRKNLNDLKIHRKIFNLTTNHRNTKQNETLFLSMCQQNSCKPIISFDVGRRELVMAIIAGVNVNDSPFGV